MQEPTTPRAVVVGVDGSKAALSAALWAVDEAVRRDIPLRLVYAIDQRDSDVDPDDEARRLAKADIVIRQAIMEIEAAAKPVKIEVEITRGCATQTLVRASKSAAMVCVGPVGYSHFQPGQVGSTAAVVASAAHCPVAIVRGRDRASRRHGDWILVEADHTPDNGVVLEAAMEEARLRNAPLRVITCWQSQLSDIHDPHAVSDGNRRVSAQLDRRLARWTRRYPELEVESVAVHGSIVSYLAKNADSAQLIVAGSRDPQHVGQLVGPTGNAALHQTDCSVLIVNRQHL